MFVYIIYLLLRNSNIYLYLPTIHPHMWFCYLLSNRFPFSSEDFFSLEPFFWVALSFPPSSPSRIQSPPVWTDWKRCRAHFVNLFVAEFVGRERIGFCRGIRWEQFGRFCGRIRRFCLTELWGFVTKLNENDTVDRYLSDNASGIIWVKLNLFSDLHRSFGGKY